MKLRTLCIIMTALPLALVAVNLVDFARGIGEHSLIWAAIMLQTSQQMLTVFKGRIWPPDA